MRIAITGHRPNKLGNDYDLTSPLIFKIKDRLIKIIKEKNPSYLISGLALGIDSLWAEIALEMKIPLIAAVPCLDQDKLWREGSKEKYRNYLQSAAYVKYVTKEPYSYVSMQKRNEWMVDNCDLLIAVWDGTSGGTGNCVKYAKNKKELLIINPNDL